MIFICFEIKYLQNLNCVVLCPHSTHFKLLEYAANPPMKDRTLPIIKIIF